MEKPPFVSGILDRIKLQNKGVLVLLIIVLIVLIGVLVIYLEGSSVSPFIYGNF